MCRLPAAALALLLTGTACVAPGASVEEPAPTLGLPDPTFAPLPSASPEPSTTDPVTPTADAASPTGAATTLPSPSPAGPSPVPDGTTDPVASPSATPPDEPAAPAPVRGMLVDGTGDLRGLESGRAPGHADLRELALTMGTDQGRITIAFAEPAPEQGEGDEVLNVATYHDVTGDGRVDYEIWASMTANGWGTSWFDLRNDTARYAADDEVDVDVVGGVVVLTFPPGHLDHARSGQWLASSEWGTALAISSGTSTTDDAPDDRSGAVWPS